MGWLACRPMAVFDEGTIVEILCVATEADGEQRMLTIPFDRRCFAAFLESLSPDEEGRVEMPEVLWWDGERVRLEEPDPVAEKTGK
jgi:hypothetical protein